MTNIQDQCTDVCRTGLAAAVEMMTATVEGAERLRTHQLAIITQVLAENAELTAQINDTKSLDDLLAVYAALAETQFKNMSAYWSGFRQVVRENQGALHQRGRAQMTEMQRQLVTSLEAVVNGGPESMVEAVKRTVGASSSAYGMLSQAAEVMARLAADQVKTADAGVRPAATVTQSKSA